MTLDITHRFELQKLVLLNADSEAAVSFNQNFVEPQGVDPDVLHQTRLGRDYRRICAGNTMQDLDKASLHMLLIGASLGQYPHPSDPAKVPVWLRFPVAPVPAELLVDGVVINVNEEGEAIVRETGNVGGHQDFRDLVEIPSQR